MGIRIERRTLTVIAVIAAVLVFVAVALASTYGRTIAALSFTTQRPAHSTGVGLSIHYQDEKDHNAKPKTFHELDITMPAGSHINQSVVPACTASDSELMAEGASACPDSKVGVGAVTLITGFPPPGDVIASDVTVLQGQGELLDLFRPHGKSQTVAVDHIKIDGRTLIDKPQSVPGGPPDGRSAVRDVHITIYGKTKHGKPYLQTPAVCPTARHWETRFTVFYDDSVTDVERSSSRCTPVARGPAMHLSARPRQARVGERVRFRFRVSSAASGCVKGVTIRFAGRKAETGRRGHAAITRRLHHRGTRRVVASKPGCGHALATVKAVAERSE